MAPQSLECQPSPNAFVGRARELAELRAGLDNIRTGHGRLLLLSGEPGIGKTRLAEEISNDAAARGMRVVWGRCWEGGGAPAYWPLTQIVRACVDDRDGERLKALVGSGASEIARLIPELKLSLPSLEQTTATTDSESARFRLFDAVATLLKNVACAGPLLMVVDDLHDADQPSLQMLRFIARETKDALIMMVGTYRDAEVRRSPELGKLIGDLNREGRMMPIAGLSPVEVGEFVQRSAGHKVHDKLIADLYRATDGNPLFVDGVVRLLIAEGKVDQPGLDGEAFKLPEGVRESIRRQLAALSVEANWLLSIASVIGDEFETRLLERVSGRSPEQIVEQTAEAVRIGILKPRGPVFARQQFFHALIREVLYDDLAANRRVELHGRIGAAIEEIYKADLKPQLAQLAHHFRAAGVVEKAIDYSIGTGEAAYRIFAFEEASLGWRAALQLMEEHNTDLQNQARLLERLATLMYVTDLSDPKGIEYLERALRIYEECGQTERAALVHSRMGAALAMWSTVRNPPRAMEHYRKAEAILGKGADSIRKANLYAGMAIAALHLMLREEGLAWSRAAMDISERIGNEEVWVNTACLHALHLFDGGRLAQALTLVDEASNRADRLVTATSVYYAPWNSGALRVHLLDPTEAPFWLLRELAKPRLAHVTGPRLGLLGRLLAAYVVAGDLARARRVWEEADLSSSAGGFHWLVATGEFERAEIQVAKELERTRSAGSRDQEWGIATFLARTRQVLGDLEGAERVGRIAVETAQPDVPGVLRTGSLLAEIYAEMGHPARAREHLTRCREILGNGEDWRGLVGVVARAEAMVAVAESNYQNAEKRFETALEIFRQYHVPFEEAEALYYWGRALNASGQHVRANEKLDTAIEIYERCGAGQRWVERVEAERPRSAPKTMPARPGQSDQKEAVFRQEGDYWTIAYEGRIFRLKDMKGLSHIAVLLRHPGEDFHVLNLIAGNETPGDGNVDREAQAADSELAPGLDDAGEMLDAEAKASYRRHLIELRQELDEAEELHNAERAAQAKEEIDTLARELNRAVGLRGRDRRAASASERARVNVNRAIKAAVERIAEQDATLGRLLETTIQTGTFCSYTPDARFPVTWQL